MKTARMKKSEAVIALSAGLIALIIVFAALLVAAHLSRPETSYSSRKIIRPMTGDTGRAAIRRTISAYAPTSFGAHSVPPDIHCAIWWTPILRRVRRLIPMSRRGTATSISGV